MQSLSFRELRDLPKATQTAGEPRCAARGPGAAGPHPSPQATLPCWGGQPAVPVRSAF